MQSNQTGLESRQRPPQSEFENDLLVGGVASRCVLVMLKMEARVTRLRLRVSGDIQNRNALSVLTLGC